MIDELRTKDTRLTPLEERIEGLIAPVVETTGFELVRVRLTGGQRKTLQIMAERADKTMSAEDCAVLSRALSPILEEADPITDPYRLEVSSPGIDRPLTRLKDFHDWQGYEAKLELDRLVEGRKRFRGTLAGTDDNMVCIDLDGEDETAMIPFAWVQTANLVLTDELIRESLKAAKASQSTTPDGEEASDEESEPIAAETEKETTHAEDGPVTNGEPS
ncbi:MAG: ribosome maturation factor RimP [Pseudomonadota bacterium]